MSSEAERQFWQEEWSDVYQALAAVAVPSRAEQIATILALIPFGVNESFQVVELGSGEGLLAAALLEAFPRANVLALDGSEKMRQTTAENLHGFQERFEIAPFDLFDSGWMDRLDGANVVMSSLVIHHLDGSGKKSLFASIHKRIADRGALVIADIVESRSRVGNGYFGATLDAAARRQSRQIAGSDELYDLFRREDWNIYRYPDPAVDKPSPLYDQLRWLEEAGFIADCWWMNAGHVIYGGFKEEASPDNDTPVDYQTLLKIAYAVLGQREGQMQNDD